MKKLWGFLTRIAVCIVFGVLFFNSHVVYGQLQGASAQRLTAEVDERLSNLFEQAEDGELVQVSIVMRAQVQERALAECQRIADKDTRRDAVINLLKTTATRSQRGVIRFLDQKLVGGSVADIQPLWIANVVGASVSEDVLMALAARPDVMRISDNAARGLEVFPVEPPQDNDEDEGSGTIECGVSLMQAPAVWAKGFTGAGVVVCVIDSGCCIDHPDLENQIWNNANEIPANGIDDDQNGYVDDVHGWNFADNNNFVYDLILGSDGHGTHVSGTVAGDGTNGMTTGMAPDAQLMTCRIIGQANLVAELQVWASMQYAMANGADVITASIGWRHEWGPDRATWRNVCENTIAAGLVVIYAAGNEGGLDGIPPFSRPDNIRTPGDVPGVITVGATNCNDERAAFSGIGPVTWQNVSPFFDYPLPMGVIKPTIMAPGVNTISTDFNCSSYTTKSGTSMATPHVAGCVALMLQANPGLDQRSVKLILGGTATGLGLQRPNNLEGLGRVNALRAIQAVCGDCDVNGDGVVDHEDRDIVGFLICNQNPVSDYPNADFNENGVFDHGDMTLFRSCAGAENGLREPYNLADASFDGCVDVSDFNRWNNNKFTNQVIPSLGDFNSDCFVDVSDFNLWNSAKFTCQF